MTLEGTTSVPSQVRKISFYWSPHHTRASRTSLDLSEALYHFLATLEHAKITEFSGPRWKGSEPPKVTHHTIPPSLHLHCCSGSTGNSGSLALWTRPRSKAQGHCALVLMWVSPVLFRGWWRGKNAYSTLASSSLLCLTLGIFPNIKAGKIYHYA